MQTNHFRKIIDTGPALGPELVVNNGFDSGANWQLIFDAVIADGLGKFNPDRLSYIIQTIFPSGGSGDAQGTEYLCAFDVVFIGPNPGGRLAGGGSAFDINVAFPYQLGYNENILIHNGTGNRNIQFYARDLHIDNVSIKKIL